MLGGNEMINKLVRVLGLGLMIATFAFVGFAQERTRAIVYEEYTKNFESKDPAKIQVALDAAKEYVSKFNTPDDKAQVDYFNSAIPTLEKSIADLKKATEDAGKKEAESKEWYALLGRVEAANKAKNWTELYTAGKQAIDKPIQYLDQATIKSQKLDLAIILGVAGFDRAFTDKVDTYNADALTYLKSAIQQIEGGQTSKTFGLLGYELNNKDNALGLMNYYVGYITYYRQKNKEAALPYFYKATQYNSAAKGFPAVYENIGAKFYDKIVELDPQRLKMIEAAPADQKDSPEIKAILAEERGNAERGIEAYSKALKAAQADAKVSQQYKDGLRATLEQLYKFRMNLKEGEKVEGLDAYINTAAAKPLTNPAEAVKPIVVEDPAPTTETTPASTTSTTPTTPGAKPATTPATTPATKPAATTPATKPAATTPATTTATKPAATATKPAATPTKTTTPKKPRRR